MAKTPEGKIKEHIKKTLDALGEIVYYCMPIGSGYGNSGVPDFIVCYSGVFIGIEAKANGGKTTLLQDHHLQRIGMACGIPLIVNERNVDDLANILHWLVSEKKGK